MKIQQRFNFGKRNLRLRSHRHWSEIIPRPNLRVFTLRPLHYAVTVCLQIKLALMKTQNISNRANKFKRNAFKFTVVRPERLGLPAVQNRKGVSVHTKTSSAPFRRTYPGSRGLK